MQKCHRRHSKLCAPLELMKIYRELQPQMQTLQRKRLQNHDLYNAHEVSAICSGDLQWRASQYQATLSRACGAEWFKAQSQSELLEPKGAAPSGSTMPWLHTQHSSFCPARQSWDLSITESQKGRRRGQWTSAHRNISKAPSPGISKYVTSNRCQISNSRPLNLGKPLF